jgi:selenide,water dikinase
MCTRWEASRGPRSRSPRCLATARPPTSFRRSSAAGSDEIKFGYAVTGEIDPARIWRNTGARAGDALVLTKALGTGIIATALKFGRATEAQAQPAVQSMVRLNRAAARIARTLPPDAVHACTDITGFGLVGHACEVAEASGATLTFHAPGLPILPGAEALAATSLPGGGRTNQEHFGARVRIDPAVPDTTRLVAFDPQTSGGLLLAIDPAAADDFQRRAEGDGIPVWIVGRVEAPDASGVLVRVV